MAAATRALKIDWAPRAGRVAHPVVNADTIWPNTLVGLDRADGMLKPWADVATYIFQGLALDGQTTSKEVAGDGTEVPANQMRVNTEGLVVRDINVTGASASTNRGAKVYCSTDNPADFTLTATSNAKAVGEVVRWKTGTTCDVQLYTPWEYRLQVLVADITALTDSTGGTAGNTIANLADGTTYANDHAAIENNFASLTAKVNAILSALNAQQ